MDKKELQKAQNIIDVLFYDDKALTQWQHTLLENVISIAQTKLHQPPVSGQLPINLILYRQAKKLDYAEFCKWLNAKCVLNSTKL